MSLINISDLTFAYDGSYGNIFEHVSFQIDTDWRLGFVGRNGRGKTTFLNILMGKYEYSGKITSSVSFDYFPFVVSDKSQMTIDVLSGICLNAEEWEIHRELNLLDVTGDVLYRPYYTLSYGEQTKILLASLFLKSNNFLLIDEPTNHLDAHARMLVGSYLKTKKGFILVSHDRLFLDNSINHVLSINKTNIEIQKGNFSSWLKNKERQDSYELSKNETLKKDIKNLSDAARRTASWSDKVEKTKFGTRDSGGKPDRGYIGHKAAKMMKRSKSIESRRQDSIDEKSKLLKNIETPEALRIMPLIYHTERLAELSDISISYGEKIVCSHINLRIEQGNRMVVRGKNGSGKSSLLKLLLKDNIDYTGNLFVANGITISYVSQDTSFLNGALKELSIDNCIDESLFKAILRKLDFSREQFEKNMKDFSEGQKKKVLIAKSLCERAHLYIWDEPLNFIDIYSRMQIEDLILDYGPTMLLVEHDGAFCDKIATHTIYLD